MPGHIRRRGPSAFQLVIELPGGTGQRRQSYVTVRGTRRDAERILRQKLAELDAGTYRAPSRETVAEFLTRWLADEVRPSCRETTADLYARIITKHLAPALGAVRLESLAALHIQQYYAAARRPKPAGPGLSPSTLNLHHTILHAAGEAAVRWRALPRNPVAEVPAPKKAKPRPRALTREQLLALLEAAAGTRHYLPILLAAGLGIREGEILGLRWEDARTWQDAAGVWRGLLTVERTIIRTKDGLSFGPLKEGDGKRLEFPLPPIVAAALARHPEEQARHRAEWGPLWEEHGLICPGRRGRPWHPSSFCSGFRQLLERRGLPPMRFHDTRHSHATLLLLAGVPLPVVSRRLGHARQSTTSDIYSHVLPGFQQAASDVAEELLRNAG